MLVVQEQPDDLLLHAFFLVINFNKLDYSAEAFPALYRRRGMAEAHMGKFEVGPQRAPVSADRGAWTVQQVMTRNQANLLLSLDAYQVLHGLLSQPGYHI